MRMKINVTNVNALLLHIPWEKVYLKQNEITTFSNNVCLGRGGHNLNVVVNQALESIDSAVSTPCTA